MVTLTGIVQFALALALAPLLQSIINRTKAAYAGRRGQPWLQPYLDLWKLLQKGAVYSRTTTALVAAGPMVGLSAIVLALLMVPVGGSAAFVSFPGDFLVVAYLLGTARFFLVLAAWDTGSSFEGMGASREVLFSALAEPATLLSLLALAATSHAASLSGIYAAVDSNLLATAAGPAIFLITGAMFVVFLAENARIPVDDPNTHLELTMIHEVMVLDHSGPDLAFIQYGAQLKMWLLGSLLLGVAVPFRTGSAWLDLLGGVLGLGLVAAVVGVVESSMARLRMVRVPQFLIAASVISIVALFLVIR
ncbi:MAG: respiratory chain complex I subunit 1 family protein [Thermoguttaceae bacterium]